MYIKVYGLLKIFMVNFYRSPTSHFYPETGGLTGIKLIRQCRIYQNWQNVSRHSAKHVNLKSNTIMKKPRDKYKKEIKSHQIISIKKQKRFILIKL
jgi:hypothetical protein